MVLIMLRCQLTLVHVSRLLRVLECCILEHPKTWKIGICKGRRMVLTIGPGILYSRRTGGGFYGFLVGVWHDSRRPFGAGTSRVPP